MLFYFHRLAAQEIDLLEVNKSNTDNEQHVYYNPSWCSMFLFRRFLVFTGLLRLCRYKTHGQPLADVRLLLDYFTEGRLRVKIRLTSITTNHLHSRRQTMETKKNASLLVKAMLNKECVVFFPDEMLQDPKRGNIRHYIRHLTPVSDTADA